MDYKLNDRNIRQVRNVTFVVTHRCNLRCEMCYFHEELKNIHDLPLELFKKVVDSTLGSRPSIQLTGGEPFTHPRLLDMVNYAKGSGLAVQIFSNGTLLRPGLIEALVKSNLDYMNITLLGDPNSHPLVANSPQAYEKLLRNLEYFAAHRGRTKIIINYTLTPAAIKDVTHAFELASRLRLDGVRLQHYMFLRQGEFAAQDRIMADCFGRTCVTHEKEEPLDVSNMAGEIINLKKRLEGDRSSLMVQWAPTLTEAEIRNWYSNESFQTSRQCFFPWRGMQVDADGKIYPCSKIYLQLGDLVEEDIFAAWNKDDMKTFRRRLKKSLFPACSRCCKL
ncbi:MAG: radical SAM protein [Thermodesulfobacteriota bacterium]